MFDEKQDKVKYYYCHHIKRYLCKDLEALLLLNANNDFGCGPILLPTCSGIDFLGSLSVPITQLSGEYETSPGLKGKNNKGFKFYLNTFLEKVDNRYKTMDEIIFNYVRCGQTHETIAKNGVLISNKDRYAKYHLKMLKLPKDRNKHEEGNYTFLYFNVLKFADDFVASLEHFEKFLAVEETGYMYERLTEHEKKQKDLIKNLVEKNRFEVEDIEISEQEDFYENSSWSAGSDWAPSLLKGDWYEKL